MAPRAAMLVGADRKEREIARDHLLPRLAGSAHTIVCDKGYAGRELADEAATLGITIVRPARKNERKSPSQPRLTTIRQRIESVFWTLKDLLSLENTAPARCTTCEPGSAAASSASPPASNSATNSADPAEA